MKKVKKFKLKIDASHFFRSFKKVNWKQVELISLDKIYVDQTKKLSKNRF